MFAVPGWSVEAKSLATQQEPIRKHVPKDSEPGAQAAQTLGKRKRKRRKDHAQTKGPVITDENLADLWSKYIEEKRQGGSNRDVPSGKTERQKKKRKENRGSIEDQVLDKARDNEAPVEEAHKENERAKGKTHPKTSHETLDFEDIAQPSSDLPTSENPESLMQKSEIKSDKKARYEQRRIRALEKRSQKSLQQANGTLPPPRAIQPDLSTTASHPTPANPPPITSATHPEPPMLHPKASATTALPELSSTTLHNTLPPPPPSTNLTPLQTSMHQKLISARFRHLNQALYTTPSTHVSSMFAESPSSYISYHAGFRAQVAVWPQNPIDTFIADTKARAQIGNKGGLLGSQKKRWREQRRGKIPEPAKMSNEENKNEEKNKLDALPRSRRGVCTIADLGCGDATLAANLAQLCKPLSLHIHSFDLATGDGPNAHLITVADICGNLPLEDSSVDVAIFCLSLMSTNWVDSVQEAARIVRAGGEVWVAEIRSRFARAGERRRGGIGQRRDEEPSADLDEEDGNKVKAGASETDVGPFVDVFRKRGFSLQGEPDLRNKMFAKMRFIKTGHEGGANSGSGFGVGAATASAGVGTDSDPRARYGPKAKKKFLDPPASVLDQQDENKVLKPCVYKTR